MPLRGEADQDEKAYLKALATFETAASVEIANIAPHRGTLMWELVVKPRRKVSKPYLVSGGLERLGLINCRVDGAGSGQNCRGKGSSGRLARRLREAPQQARPVIPLRKRVLPR